MYLGLEGVPILALYCLISIYYTWSLSVRQRIAAGRGSRDLGVPGRTTLPELPDAKP